MLITANNDIYWMGESMPKLYVFLRQKVPGMQRALSVGQPIVDLSFNRKKCFYVGMNGSIYGWGDNTWFEFNCSGSETKNKVSQLDYKIEDALVNADQKDPYSFNSGAVFLKVTCGNDCSFFITEKGVYSIGNRSTGLLGYRPPNEILIHPRKIDFGTILGAHQIIGISAGSSHVVAWSDSGKAFAWGYNYHGVLGVENNRKYKDKLFITPQPVHAFANTPIVCIEASDTCTFAINHRGRVFYWGK